MPCVDRVGSQSVRESLVSDSDALIEEQQGSNKRIPLFPSVSAAAPCVPQATENTNCLYFRIL